VTGAALTLEAGSPATTDAQGACTLRVVGAPAGVPLKVMATKDGMKLSTVSARGEARTVQQVADVVLLDEASTAKGRVVGSLLAMSRVLNDTAASKLFTKFVNDFNKFETLIRQQAAASPQLSTQLIGSDEQASNGALRVLVANAAIAHDFQGLVATDVGLIAEQVQKPEQRSSEKHDDLKSLTVPGTVLTASVDDTKGSLTLTNNLTNTSVDASNAGLVATSVVTTTSLSSSSSAPASAPVATEAVVTDDATWAAAAANSALTKITIQGGSTVQSQTFVADTIITKVGTTEATVDTVQSLKVALATTAFTTIKLKSMTLPGGRVTVNRAVTLAGAGNELVDPADGGPSTTPLAATLSHGFEVTAGNVTIRDLSIVGVGTPLQYSDVAAAIKIKAANTMNAPVTLSNVSIDYTARSINSAAVFALNSAVVVDGCTLKGVCGLNSTGTAAAYLGSGTYSFNNTTFNGAYGLRTAANWYFGGGDANVTAVTNCHFNNASFAVQRESLTASVGGSTNGMGISMYLTNPAQGNVFGGTTNNVPNNNSIN
jgi:hypothetical protein